MKKITMDVKTNVNDYSTAIEASEIIVRKYLNKNDKISDNLWYEAIKNMIAQFICEDICPYCALGDLRNEYVLARISTAVDSISKETYHDCIEQKESALLAFTILRKTGVAEYNALRKLRIYIESIMEGTF